MTMRSVGRRRWIFTTLVLVAVLSMHNRDTQVNAEALAAAASVEASRHDVEAAPQTLTTTRAHVAAPVETTSPLKEENEEFSVVRRGGVEQCSEGNMQCAEAAADAVPEPLHEELPVSETDLDDENTATMTAAAAAQASALALYMEIATRHLEEVRAQVRAWLPHVKHAASTVVSETTAAWDSLLVAWRACYHKCVILYNHFFAEAVATLVAIYRHVAGVASDVFAVVSAWAALVMGEGRHLWQTYEEVRIMTHHFVAAVLLSAFAAVLFSVYAVAATVPDAVVALWTTSLDDLTRAQLKIVGVLVLAFAVYQLRVLWSFWLLLAAIAGFYYWSGHVVAKTMPPLQRQASQAQSSSYSKATLL